MFVLFIVILSISSLAFASNSATNSCSCSSGLIGVDVDVEVAVDPSQLTTLNNTALRREKTTFQVFGKLCQPVGHISDGSVPVQLLLHGFTYSSQYWDVEWYGFQNYSYVEFSCSQGVSSFVYDNICAGRSIPPQSSKDCQLPSAAAVSSSLARKLKDGTISGQLTGSHFSFSKVFAIGHSLGSAILNFAAVKYGASSPFSGFILTGFLDGKTNIPALEGIINLTMPGQIANPGRWSQLDIGFVTTAPGKRSAFYGPNGTFDPVVLQLDTLTKDVGAVWQIIQTFTGNLDVPTEFKGPITLMGGGLDFNCNPCDTVALKEAQRPFFPEADLNLVVIEGQGHALNLEFGAPEAFQTMINLFRQGTR